MVFMNYKKQNICYLKGEMGSVRKWGVGAPRLCQSCMINNRRNHHFPACVRSVTSLKVDRLPFSLLAVSSPSHIISVATEGLRQRLYIFDGEVPNRDNTLTTYRWVCEMSGSRLKKVFHMYVNLTESRVAIVYEGWAGCPGRMLAGPV